MRFSIRWLMAIIAFVALLCMMLFALPGAAAFWSLMLTMLAVPSLAIPVIVYGRDSVRAFAIGVVSSFGLTPFALWFLPVITMVGGPSRLIEASGLDDPAEIHAWKIFFAAALASAALCGFASVAIRRACNRTHDDKEST